MPAYEYRTFGVPLAYKRYVRIHTKCLSMLKKMFLSRRMRPCLKRIQSMPILNVPLAYVSVFQRMSDIFRLFSYAGMRQYDMQWFDRALRRRRLDVGFQYNDIKPIAQKKLFNNES